MFKTSSSYSVKSPFNFPVYWLFKGPGTPAVNGDRWNAESIPTRFLALEDSFHAQGSCSWHYRQRSQRIVRPSGKISGVNNSFYIRRTSLTKQSWEYFDILQLQCKQQTVSCFMLLYWHEVIWRRSFVFFFLFFVTMHIWGLDFFDLLFVVIAMGNWGYLFFKFDDAGFGSLRYDQLHIESRRFAAKLCEVPPSSLYLIQYPDIFLCRFSNKKDRTGNRH